MNSPSDEYKYLRDLDNIFDIAYFTLFEKYMKYKLRGEKKVIEIDDTDQESLIWSKNGGFPIPGIIYTFIYKGAKDFIKIPNKNPKEYQDLVPMLFCMGIGREHFSGINLNLLPPGARLQFLQSFYDTFEDFLKREADVLAQNDKLALNKRFIAYIKSGKSQEMIKLFNKQSGNNFGFAFRKYSIGKVDELRMVEYVEWKYLPFYEPREAFRKLSQNQIYKLYSKSK